MVAIYPFMKRVTDWPQAFLGLAFSWGALMGWAATFHALALPPVLLYVGSVLWTIGYDTIYAHQDKEDDALAGVKSSALALGAARDPFAGAALLGCSGSGSKSADSGSGASAPAGAAPASGAPKNIKRADGFDPKFGQVPVNDRKVVKGGSFRRQSTDTSRENDPEVSIALSDWEYVADRLAYANGFTIKMPILTAFGTTCPFAYRDMLAQSL